MMSPAAREIVSNLTGVLVQAAHPKRIILFGAQARGVASPDSDFDIMVVEENPVDRFEEMVRLNRLTQARERSSAPLRPGHGRKPSDIEPCLHASQIKTCGPHPSDAASRSAETHVVADHRLARLVGGII